MRKAIAATALVVAIGIFLVRETVAAIARFEEQVPWDEVDPPDDLYHQWATPPDPYGYADGPFLGNIMGGY